jgi:cell wall assembly regulator SMI1
MKKFTALLDRVERWLKQHRRRYHKGLRPGATTEELAELESALGGPVPGRLADWLRWHNGQDEELIGAFVDSFNLMSTTDIAEALRQWHGKPGWVPFLDDYQGDYVAVDTTGRPLPVHEVWRGQEDSAPVAASLEAWLTGLLHDFEAGLYHEDPERGDFIRIQAGT